MPALVMLGNLVNVVNSFVLRIMEFDYSALEAVHDVAITSISLSVAWIVHRRVFSPAVLIRAGLVYCVFTALWFAATECLVADTYESDAIRIGMSYFTFVFVWVVFFPAIVPMRTGTATITILVAGFSSPAMRWAADRAGWVNYSDESLTFIAIAMFFSVVLGIAVSNVVYQLGRSVSEAREMGSYRLVKNLGAGGMGEVWSANHRMLARPAAVKFIKREVFVGMDPEAVLAMNRRFEHEVQATATLQSPHTVDIYDYGITPEGTFFYVMELLDGIDMETLVKRFGPVAPERAVYLLVQACHSLQEAHRRQLIHRDIKPANLFVCEYGEDRDFVKVLDFGLVKRDSAGGEDDLALTREGSITGTPAYLYPEAITGTSPVDHRSDLYSLGCVAHWLLTGELVFTAKTPMAMLTEHATATPVPPSKRSELAIPAALDDIVLACLAKHPDERPRGAGELARMLEGIVFDEPWNNRRAREWWDMHRVSSGAQRSQG